MCMKLQSPPSSLPCCSYLWQTKSHQHDCNIEPNYKYKGKMNIQYNGCVHSSAVGRQKLLLVKLTTIGIPLVPMFFANGIFFCRRSRVWEVLVNDVTTDYKHGGENQDISSRFWESDFLSMIIGVQYMIKMLMLYNLGWKKRCLFFDMFTKL